MTLVRTDKCMRLLTRLFPYIRVRRALRSAEWDVNRLWPSITILWATAPALYKAGIGPMAKVPIELAVIRRLSLDREDAEVLLKRLLVDSNNMLVAYGIFGLETIGLLDRSEFQVLLETRTGSVKVHAGCICGHFLLKDLIKSETLDHQ